MTLVDMVNLPQVSDPQISPDGRQVLFVRSDPDWKANRRVRHIWKVNADGSGLVQMTNGQDGEDSPRLVAKQRIDCIHRETGDRP